MVERVIPVWGDVHVHVWGDVHVHVWGNVHVAINIKVTHREAMAKALGMLYILTGCTISPACTILFYMEVMVFGKPDISCTHTKAGMGEIV